MCVDPTDELLAAVRAAALGSRRPLVLAVSGGMDSMTLLHAMVVAAPSRIAAVATFDHGTGASATASVELVRSVTARAGVRFATAVMAEVGRAPEGREAAWRAARHAFLRETAVRFSAAVATAHTADDQVETVLLRIMRGSGARGIAALYARSPLIRPLLGVRRSAVQRYAFRAGVEWIEDPSNRSRVHARNRLRHDLLPAIHAVRPGFGDELLVLAESAHRLRCDVESFVDEELRPVVDAGRRLVVASRELMDYDADSHAILWPALAGRVGLALDARGIRRIASFASSRPRDGSIPLAGGWNLEAGHDTYTLRKLVPPASPVTVARLPLSGSLAWGNFRFRVAVAGDAGSTWSASIVAPDGAVVRSWAAGDRLARAGGQQPRRVSRYLSDAGVQRADRAQWPVVVAGDEIVWIPGVRRSDAATDRSGRPARHYRCERNDR